MFCCILLCMRNLLFSKYLLLILHFTPCLSRSKCDDILIQAAVYLLMKDNQKWIFNVYSPIKVAAGLGFSPWSCLIHKLLQYLNYCVPFCFCQTRLVRELEKKFSGKHVVIVAQVCDFLHSFFFFHWQCLTFEFMHFSPFFIWGLLHENLANCFWYSLSRPKEDIFFGQWEYILHIYCKDLSYILSRNTDAWTGQK